MNMRTIRQKRKLLESRKVLRRIQMDYLLYIMLIPGIIYFVLFHYMPMYGVSIAFRDYNIVGGMDNAPWVGWEIFEKLFKRSAFRRALSNNIRISLIKIFFGFPLPIMLSLILGEVWSPRFRKVVQTTIIMPSFLSWFVVYGILVAMCNLSDGVIPSVTRAVNHHFGLSIPIVNFMTTKETFDGYMMITYIWKEIGMGTVVYLAAIIGVDRQLYEAASIDGAGRFKQILHVTLPCIRSVIVMQLIFRVGRVMNAGFDQMFALSNSMVISRADIIDTYVYRVGMEEAKFSLATAAGLFKSFIGLVLVLTTNQIARHVDPDSAIM